MLDFPCLSMDNDRWISTANAADIADAMSSVAIEEPTTDNHNPWLLPKNAKPVGCHIMAPVLKETSRDMWLLTAEPEARVPNPNASLWLAASTASICSQSDNISWPKETSDWLESNKRGSDWLEGGSMTSSASSVDWLKEGQAKRSPIADWPFLNSESQDWLAAGRQESALLSSASSSTLSEDLSAWMQQPVEGLSSVRSANSVEDLDAWTHSSAKQGVTSPRYAISTENLEAWRQQQEEDDACTVSSRPGSPAVEAWLASAMAEEEEHGFEEDGGSSIVVLSEPMEDEDELGFWLI